jgi:hypothetical protein
LGRVLEFGRIAGFCKEMKGVRHNFVVRQDLLKKLI